MDLDEKDYALFLEGDMTGFENLVLRYKNNLIYFLQRYVSSLDDAEDLAQDAFVEVLVHKERYRGGGFKTYLFTIGRNKAVDYIRRNSRLIPTDELPEQTDEFDLEREVLKKEEKIRISKALTMLKPSYREVIILIDFEEMSYKDAGRVLGKSLPQIKVLLHRARKAAGALLQKDV